MSRAPESCPAKTAQNEDIRFSKLENDITEIKQALRESLHVSKTWAQVARNSMERCKVVELFNAKT
jgi:hypothetical protein